MLVLDLFYQIKLLKTAFRFVAFFHLYLHSTCQEQWTCLVLCGILGGVLCQLGSDLFVGGLQVGIHVRDYMKYS